MALHHTGLRTERWKIPTMAFSQLMRCLRYVMIQGKRATQRGPWTSGALRKTEAYTEHFADCTNSICIDSLLIQKLWPAWHTWWICRVCIFHSIFHIRTQALESTTSFAATVILQNSDFSKSAAARRTINFELIASPGRSYFGFSTHFAMHSAGT